MREASLRWSPCSVPPTWRARRAPRWPLNGWLRTVSLNPHFSSLPAKFHDVFVVFRVQPHHHWRRASAAPFGQGVGEPRRGAGGGRREGPAGSHPPKWYALFLFHCTCALNNVKPFSVFLS